mgnify:CR=1 FL=1
MCICPARNIMSCISKEVRSRVRVGLAQNQVNKGKGVRGSTHITPTCTGEGPPHQQKVNHRPDRRAPSASWAPVDSPLRPWPNTPGSPPGPARQPVPQRPATDLSGPSGTRHEASETVCFQQCTFLPGDRITSEKGGVHSIFVERNLLCPFFLCVCAPILLRAKTLGQ